MQEEVLLKGAVSHAVLPANEKGDKRRHITHSFSNTYKNARCTVHRS
jgi:hypothetical protein